MPLTAPEPILDQYDESGNTLLHLIAEGKEREFTFAVKPYLTDARVAAQNHRGNTVLHTHAKYIGQKDCWLQTMPIYLKHSNGGATLSIQNNDGDTALGRFYIYRPWDPYDDRPSVSDWLVRRDLPNIDFNAPSADGLTVLTLAIGAFKFDEATKLLEHGASPSFQGTDEKFSTAYVLKTNKEALFQKTLDLTYEEGEYLHEPLIYKLLELEKKIEEKINSLQQ